MSYAFRQTPDEMSTLLTNSNCFANSSPTNRVMLVKYTDNTFTTKITTNPVVYQNTTVINEPSDPLLLYAYLYILKEDTYTFTVFNTFVSGTTANYSNECTGYLNGINIFTNNYKGTAVNLKVGVYLLNVYIPKHTGVKFDLYYSTPTITSKSVDNLLPSCSGTPTYDTLYPIYQMLINADSYCSKLENISSTDCKKFYDNLESYILNEYNIKSTN